MVEPIKINEPCPHCKKRGVNSVGKYKKGWTMKKRQQLKGGEHGQTEVKGMIEISLYKCEDPNCRRIFRKGRFVPNKGETANI